MHLHLATVLLAPPSMDAKSILIFFFGCFRPGMTRARNVNPSFKHTFGGRLYDMMKTDQQEYELLSILYTSKPYVDKPR
jgi:hypothetical protein